MNAATRNATLAVAVVALAGAAGFLLYRTLGRPAAALSPVPSATSPAASVAALPSAAVPANPPAEASGKPAVNSPARRVIPDRVPAVTLAGLNGKPRALADFRDKALVINFWATWCVPCRREIPLLRQLRRERRSSGVEVVGIAVDFQENVQKYARDIGIDYPLLIGEEDGLAAAESFGMDLVLPFTVFADAERRIVAVKVGELHADEAKLILDTVQQINAKTLDLALAKPQIAAKMRELATQRALEAAAAPKT